MRTVVTMVIEFNEYDYTTDDDLLEELANTIEDNPDFIVVEAMIGE